MPNKLLNSRSMMDPQDTYVLRGICMLMIIVHHVLKFAPYAPISVRGLWGDMGTAVFFFISGWGLYCSMEKREKVDWSYLWQNMKKLLVPFYIVWVLTEIAFQIIRPEYGWSRILCDGITLSYPSFEGVNLWFFKVITSVYIVSILTFMLVKKRWLRVSIVALLCGIYIYLGWKVIRLPQYMWGSVICFPAGMWLSAYKEELKNVLSHKWAIAIASLVLYVVFRNYAFLPLRACLKYSLAFCMLFVSLGSIVNIPSKLLYFIGKNSLLFYLIHIAILLLLTEILGGIHQYYMLILGIVLVMTLALCWAYIKSKELIEKHI